MAVPNVSEGRDRAALDAIAAAFAGERALGGEAPTPVRLLDVHSDEHHHRSVFTLAGPPAALADALLGGARAALEHIDVVHPGQASAQSPGQHPHVGAVDVMPIVYLKESSRGAACAQALLVADRLGEELALPVFLYGELTRGQDGSERTRAQLRRGGVQGLSRRMQEQALRPDFGPRRPHPTAGATLVAARPPLVAFNLQLAPPAGIERARAIAALLREGGEQGLPGLRAIAVALGGGVAQVSMNVEQPYQLPLAAVVDAVARQAPVLSAEIVGLAPAAALEGFPAEVPLPGFDPRRHIIENALGD